MAAYNPIKPSEFKALIPGSDDSVCEILIKYFKFTVLFWRYFSWLYTLENGQWRYSDDFIEMTCESMKKCDNIYPNLNIL